MSSPVDPPNQAAPDEYRVPETVAGHLVWPVRIVTVVAAVFMLSIAVVTFVDVTGRYVFNSPIPGGVEIIEFLLGLMIFSALPLVTVKRGQITVQLFDGIMGPRFRKSRDIVVLIASAGMLVFITERMWATALDMAENADVSLHLQVPTAPLLFALTVLSCISVIVQLYMVWRRLMWGWDED